MSAPSRSSGPALPPDIDGWALPNRGSLRRRAVAALRLVAVFAWTFPILALQAVMIALPNRGPLARGTILVPRLYWSGMCAILGLKVQVVGTPAHLQARQGGRPVLYVSNHSSWLDIPILGSKLEACFIAKADVARWPVIRTVARLGRTVYTSRQRNTAGRERDEMRTRLAGGDNLVLFPEGTTSDGSRVLEFRSAFLSLAEMPPGDPTPPPIIQPVSLAYDRLSGLPTGRASRPLFAWYGDMEIAPHFWQLAQYGGLRATIVLHTPLDPLAFPNRKALTRATWTAAATGAATLRQNRPAQPLTMDPNQG